MAESRRPRLTDDDLLAGFDESGPSRGRLGGFFAITIGGSLYAWDIAFTFGAYHTLFYQRRHQLLVVSLVVLLGGLIMRRRLRFRLWLLALFAPPVVLLLLQLAVPANSSGTVVRDVYHVLVVATVAVLPVVAWVVARLIAPDYFHLPDRRAKLAVVVIIAVVTALGYGVGRLNDRFLTCGDFRISGNAQPTNCVHVRHR